MQSILASLDSCNQASLFCNIRLTEQTSQTNLLTHLRRELKAVSPKILQGSGHVGADGVGLFGLLLVGF